MKLTLIGLLIIIIIMLFVQISFRDNFDIKQKAFREDKINYNLKKLRSIDSDGKEVQCGEIDGDKIIRKNENGEEIEIIIDPYSNNKLLEGDRLFRNDKEITELKYLQKLMSK